MNNKLSFRGAPAVARIARTGRALAVCGFFSVALSGPATADDFQSWLQFNTAVELPGRVSVNNDFVARFSESDGGLYEIENATMLGYRLPRKVTLWAGYVHNPLYDAGDFAVLERRGRQQVSIDDLATIGRISLSGRLRMEQRWREGVEGTAWRVRPYLKAAIPLGGRPAATLNISEELFVNLSETDFQSSRLLDRLRTSVTVSMPVAKGLKLEAGYLNQKRFGGDADHALTAQVGLAF